jgi:ATP-dependent Clp protease ATP-binding subunit ClpB
LLDDGRLTDGQGRTVDFRNTVVIMTSNLGNELWLNHTGSGTPSKDEVNRVMQAHFRPEFLNRIDEIVIFRPLSREDLSRIVEIQLKRMAALLEGRGYHLDVSAEAKDYLAEIGYDVDYGARPLKRAIQRELQDPLAVHLLAGDFPEGATIRVEREGERLSFKEVI